METTEKKKKKKPSVKNRFSLIKDILLVTTPIVMAIINILYSYFALNKQMDFNSRSLEEQMNYNKIVTENQSKIDKAKLIKDYSELIVKGGNETYIAQVGLEVIDLNDVQRQKLTRILEDCIGRSDSPVAEVSGRFEKVLNNLFSEERDTRATAYERMQDFMLVNPKEEYVSAMFSKIKEDPLNITGRSNCLSIISEMKGSDIQKFKYILEPELKRIEDLESEGVMYGIGPQTKEWISTIKGKL